MNPVLVVGGYGTFGQLVCRELARRGISITVAGRDRGKALQFAETLGPSHDAVSVDLSKPGAFPELLAGRQVALHCAGPFQAFDTAFLDACQTAGCHYADINDDRDYAAAVMARGRDLSERGLIAAWGCSSLPAVSVALGKLLIADCDDPPETARVTLFIGNDNPKGAGAIASMLTCLGRRIAVPDGFVMGGLGREIVELPPPFGRRTVFHFNSPDYDVMPIELGVSRVRVKLGFELRPATEALMWLAQLRIPVSPRLAAGMARCGRLVRGVGCSGGAVMTELWWADGRFGRASLTAPEHGQLIAALPCAWTAAALLEQPPSQVGAMTAEQFLGAERLLAEFTQIGMQVAVRLPARHGAHT